MGLLGTRCCLFRQEARERERKGEEGSLLAEVMAGSTDGGNTENRVSLCVCVCVCSVLVPSLSIYISVISYITYIYYILVHMDSK